MKEPKDETLDRRGRGRGPVPVRLERHRPGSAPDAQAALLFSACWLLPVSIAVWALGSRQARAILAGRGGLRRAAWEGFCWGAGLGLAVVLLSNAPDALAAGGALEGQPLFSGHTARFLLDGRSIW